VERPESEIVNAIGPQVGGDRWSASAKTVTTPLNAADQSMDAQVSVFSAESVMNPRFPAAQDEGQASTSIGASSEDLLRFDCMQSFLSFPAPLHPEQGSLSFLWEDLIPDDNNTIQDAVEGLDLTPFNIFNPVADGCDLFAAPLPERTEPDMMEMNGIGMSMVSVKRL
jgi:hypothetical protein